MHLDHRKLLRGDPGVTIRCMNLARGWIERSFRKRSVVNGLVQETMEEVLTKLLERPGDPPEPERMKWLILACANNVVRRELTRRKRALIVAFDSQVHTKERSTISEVVACRLELERVNRALQECDERTRTVLLARLAGSTYAEICAEHGGEADPTRAFVVRERRKLRDQLTAMERRKLMQAEIRRMREHQHLQWFRIAPERE